MFKILNKKINVLAPFDGTVIDVTEINDPVFSNLMMGDGVAICPTSNEVHSPCEGTIKVIAETKHAICLQTKDGLEMIVHYGIDTVKHHGKGFEVKVSVEDHVKAGDLLCCCDSEYFKKMNVDLTSPILILNGDKFEVVEKNVGKNVKKGDCIFKVVKKQ